MDIIKFNLKIEQVKAISLAIKRKQENVLHIKKTHVVKVEL